MVDAPYLREKHNTAWRSPPFPDLPTSQALEALGVELWKKPPNLRATVAIVTGTDLS